MKFETNKILSWDIETVPQENFSTESPMFASWENKWRSLNLTFEELIEKYEKEAGLFAEYGKIACISCSYLHNDKLVFKSFTGDEKSIILRFLDACDKFVGKRGGLINLFFNGVAFDIPFLRKRASIYVPMFDYPQYLCDLWEKPWTFADRVIDLQVIHQGTGRYFSSLAEVTHLYDDVVNPKANENGSNVYELYKQGKIAEIAKYCEGDTGACWAIFMKWSGLPLPERMTESVKEETVAPLKTLLNKGKLTKAEQAKLDKKTKNLKGKKKENKELIESTIQMLNPEAKI